MRILTNILFTFLLIVIPSINTNAQINNPISFKVTHHQVGDHEVELVFKGIIKDGWHVYGTDNPADGPVAAKVVLEDSRNAQLSGRTKGIGKEIRQYDENFETELSFYEKNVEFTQRIHVSQDSYSIAGYLTYGACSESGCLPPQSVDFSFEGSLEKSEQASAETEDSITSAAIQTTAADSSATASVGIVNDLWTPVIDKLNNTTSSAKDNAQQSSLLGIFLLGFLGGLVALLTPCVWPIIPMTVSFFLKRGKEKKRAVRDAFTYGVSIVVIYMLLAVFVTMIFGANQLNALSTNAFVNIFFFLLLVVFGLSFLGLFDLSLPASWSSAVDSKAEKTTGLLSIFLMAFTLAIVSFSCTGPIIGFLLVEVATTGELLAPSLGMLGFALALALPFTLFALFPTLLKQAPKSGSWMVIVKVTLGFIELAFALKFLSVADMAYGWNLLFRDLFIAIWIILFAWLSLFLLGVVRIPDDHRGNKGIGKVRIALGCIVALFTIYMVPGLWGEPVKAISAFTPPMNTQKWKINDNSIETQFKDYEEGMAYAKKVGKPVMIDFTGLGCVNCRKMEAAVWTEPKVKEMIEDNFVLIELVVDNKEPLATKQIVSEADGSKTTLRTIGDKWSYLQRYKFGSNAQPFHVLLDNEGNPLNGSYGYDEDIDKYIDFLKTGLLTYNKKH